MTSAFKFWLVVARSVRRLCIALNASAEASAMTDKRAAVCSRARESQAVAIRKATTQAAITAMTDLSNAEMVRRFSIRIPTTRLVEGRMVNNSAQSTLGELRDLRGDFMRATCWHGR